jgi:hypothetical protein
LFDLQYKVEIRENEEQPESCYSLEIIKRRRTLAE